MNDKVSNSIGEWFDILALTSPLPVGLVKGGKLLESMLAESYVIVQ